MRGELHWQKVFGRVVVHGSGIRVGGTTKNCAVLVD